MYCIIYLYNWKIHTHIRNIWMCNMDTEWCYEETTRGSRDVVSETNAKNIIERQRHK